MNDIPIPFGDTSKLIVVWDWTEWLDDRGVLIASFSFPPTKGIVSSSRAMSEDSKQISALISLSETIPIGTRIRVPCAIVTTGNPAENETRSRYIIITQR